MNMPSFSQGEGKIPSLGRHSTSSDGYAATFSFNGDVNPFVRFADISPSRGIASRRRQDALVEPSFHLFSTHR